MTNQQSPNILVVIADGMQSAVVVPDHDCQTPNLQKLADTGVLFTRAHTSCPVCSPARASLMTGLLPHNHGVLDVEHAWAADQSVLRPRPHWAQRLAEAGYRTGFFGKWHIERTDALNDFGWQQYQCLSSEHLRHLGQTNIGRQTPELIEELSRYVEGPPGYNRILHYGVTDQPQPLEQAAESVAAASRFIEPATAPWCCVLSFAEPNEALIVSREEFDRYDPSQLKLPENLNDDLSDRPAWYRRQREISRNVSDDQWRMARACYYGRITQIDRWFGALWQQLDKSQQLSNTVVVFLADHGRYVGSHGFDAHNCGAFEEIYRIPLMIAAPGIESGVCNQLVGIQDLCPTIMELAGARSFSSADSHSLVPLLTEPDAALPRCASGFSEYHGTRFPMMQRVIWSGDWKLVFNGFDFDELYNLCDDPHEMQNLIAQADCAGQADQLMRLLWNWVRRTGDRTIEQSHYYSLRVGRVGPNESD